MPDKNPYLCKSPECTNERSRGFTYCSKHTKPPIGPQNTDLEGQPLKRNKQMSPRDPLSTPPQMAPPKAVRKEPNKYMRQIKPGVFVDVYDVIQAFGVVDGGFQHAIKKLLAVGQRGHKDESEDRKDIAASIKRSNEIYEEWLDND